MSFFIFSFHIAKIYTASLPSYNSQHHNRNFKTALGPTMATSKCHLDQEYSGLQSTKQINQDTENFFPQKDNPTMQAIFSICNATDINKKSYLDLTGKFPYTSSRGSKYLLIVYDHDSNMILAETLKTR